jgi:4-alpha-glucanotransferase
MRVLQFSFGGEAEQLPAAYAEDTVAYPGTHDNNTSQGWFDVPAPAEGEPGREGHLAERERARAFALGYSDDLVWGFVEGAWASASRLAIVPAQDLLGLGAAYRMNTPGTIEGNWRFRLEPGALTPDLAARLRGITEKHHRL